MKYHISQLCGDSPLKAYYISPERFNCWWILTDSSRKGCGGKIPSARQNFILTPCWFTAAPLRAVTFIHRFPVHSKQDGIFSCFQHCRKLQKTLNAINCSVVRWWSQLNRVFVPQFLSMTAHFWPHTLLPPVVPAQLFMELSCKLG